jgi:hypothetical protein
MRYLIFGLSLAVGVGLIPPNISYADTTRPIADENTGDINLNAVTGVVYTDGGGGPRCSWSRYTVGRLEDGLGNPPESPREYDTPDEKLTPEELQARNAERTAAAEAERQRRASTAVPNLGGVPHYVYDVRCPGFSASLRFVPTNLTAADLIPGVEAAAHGRIEVPVPDVSPKFEYTGYVNLGMWLAVEPVTVTPISAEAGPTAWITLTPQHTSISFDFGNGDTVTCDGTGVPIIDTDTFDEGPCGYTYRLSSPDDDPYQVTITTTWELPYTSSGGPGTLGPFSRSITVDHNVDELQTVGVSN